MSFLLGIDDTDSRFGHCTTHLGYLMTSELASLGCTFPAYPRLVRLNPNVPFKTRGNAAVCIEFEAGSESLRDEAFRAAERLMEEEADVENGANAALVMAPRDDPERLEFFRQVYLRAVSGIVNYRGVIRAVSEMGIPHRLLGNGMGVVGAVASMGFSCDLDDHTYELIAYRRPERCGTRRALETGSVSRDGGRDLPAHIQQLRPRVRAGARRPHRPRPRPRGGEGGLSQDGARGVPEDPHRRGAPGARRLRDQPVHRRAPDGQARDAPQGVLGRLARGRGGLGPAIPGRPPRCSSCGATTPRPSTCMVYEPSGDLRRAARLLRPGDSVRVSGGVRRATSKNPAVVNVEKIDVLSISTQSIKANPRCAACGSGMKSEGKGKGYQCRKCGHKSGGTGADRAPKAASSANPPGHLSSLPSRAEAPDQAADTLRQRVRGRPGRRRGVGDAGGTLFMTFHSILFEGPEDETRGPGADPEYFVDLNLNQIVDAIIAGKEDYGLRPFFLAPLEERRRDQVSPRGVAGPREPQACTRRRRPSQSRWPRCGDSGACPTGSSTGRSSKAGS